MDAPAPAPASTRISSPAVWSLPSASGTRATRRSPGAVSLATPTFMGITLKDLARVRRAWGSGIPGKDSGPRRSGADFRGDPGRQAQPRRAVRPGHRRGGRLLLARVRLRADRQGSGRPYGLPAGTGF